MWLTVIFIYSILNAQIDPVRTEQGTTVGVPDTGVTCSDPGEIKGGWRRVTVSIKTPFLPGTQIHYSCYKDMALLGSSKMVCNHLGFWDPPEKPTCTYVESCPHPVNYPNSEFEFINAPEREKQKVLYTCKAGYHRKGRVNDEKYTLMECQNGEWVGGPPNCVPVMCVPPGDKVPPHGNWYMADDGYYKPGSKIEFECMQGFTMVGSRIVECLNSGSWSDIPPRCIPDDRILCYNPGVPDNGYHLCKSDECSPSVRSNMYYVGAQLAFYCNENFEPVGGKAIITCGKTGKWDGIYPQCRQVASTSPVPVVTVDHSPSTMTIVIAISCSILGILLLITILVAFQRKKIPFRCYNQTTRPPGGPPPYSPTSNNQEVQNIHRDSIEEHDQVALIACTDGGVHMHVVLPSYEEAVRRTNSGARSPRGGNLRHLDYRPLPSLPPNMRGRDTRSLHERDSRRTSTITTTSTNRDALSENINFGSIDTMNVSDTGTVHTMNTVSDASTSVTVDTMDSNLSNPSIATSRRATAGSMSSNDSLANEDAPLLSDTGRETRSGDQQSHTADEQDIKLD
ncbi:unnamed protein product [Owenia fusiformis]|uniref:Sushi domain-containing protein n=1 Tax=Owenia fusiformis TaxID=6347 RepID=A0A8S4PGR0_OWEFU|nr:unnamed protein product [Owenia fusiformis]